VTESENLPSADIRITRKFIFCSGRVVFKSWANLKQRNVTGSPRGNWKTNMPVQELTGLIAQKTLVVIGRRRRRRRRRRKEKGGGEGEGGGEGGGRGEGGEE
jgi:hypothetical protein